MGDWDLKATCLLGIQSITYILQRRVMGILNIQHFHTQQNINTLSISLSNLEGLYPLQQG